MTTTLVDRLIEQTDELAGTWATGAGRPRQADLRRAVSASYYALFHEATGSIAPWLAPTLPTEVQDRLRRHFTHAGMKRVCGWVSNPGSAPQTAEHVRPIADVATRSVELDEAAQAFVDLQSRRHKADYDHLAVFGRDAVRADIQQAEDAIRHLRLRVGTVELEAFAVLMSLHGGR